MARLRPDFTPKFHRDYKRLVKRGINTAPLREVVGLILENTLATREELVRHHNMHRLSGTWSGSNECHVCNAGDWLLVWAVRGELAVFQRTGTHREIFR